MGAMFGRHGEAMAGGHGGLLPRVEFLEGDAVIQAAAIDALERGAMGFSIIRVDPPLLVVPASADYILYPITGALDDQEPPDVGIWEITENGTIKGSNDVASRYILAVTLDYRDNNSGNVNWSFAFARGKDLHTATPTLTTDRVTMPGRTNVMNTGDPDGRCMTAQFEHPASGDLTEYGLMVKHDILANVQFRPVNMTIVYASIGSGTP